MPKAFFTKSRIDAGLLKTESITRAPGRRKASHEGKWRQSSVDDAQKETV